MKVLLISTENNERFSVAFGEFDKKPRVKTINKPFKQSEMLLSEINKVVGKNTPDGFIVVSGPGAFSGLRIGIATANALAFALKKPIVGVQLKKSWLNLTEQEKIMRVWEAGVNFIHNSEFGQPAEAFAKAGIHNSVRPEYGAEPNIGRKAKTASRV
jgi:tRNA A37 threonylcarbamoyladenosine modification protein TsaB